MDESNIIVIANRTTGKKSFNAAGGSFLISFAIFIVDLIFFLTNRQTWNVVLLIISSIFAGLSLIGVLFFWGNYRYAKKVASTPLLSFDEAKGEFEVQDFIYHKPLTIKKEDILRIEINEKDEAHIFYNENGKEKTTNIGFAYKGEESKINEAINKLKA